MSLLVIECIKSIEFLQVHACTHSPIKCNTILVQPVSNVQFWLLEFNHIMCTSYKISVYNAAAMITMKEQGGCCPKYRSKNGSKGRGMNRGAMQWIGPQPGTSLTVVISGKRCWD